MGFIENIAASFGLENSCPLFRVSLIGENNVYVEGVASIKSYSPDKIELTLKKGGFIIAGKELFVKKYCAGDLAVCGKIKSLERI